MGDARVVVHKRWQAGAVMGKREQKDERRRGKGKQRIRDKMDEIKGGREGGGCEMF